MRGNVDTRLNKLERGDFDAIVLARAGLERLGREDAIGCVLDPGVRSRARSGASSRSGGARHARAGRREAAHRSPMRSPACWPSARWRARWTRAATRPSAPTPCPRRGALRLRAWVGLPDGSAWASDELAGDAADPAELGREVAAPLKLAGAGGSCCGAAEQTGRTSTHERARLPRRRRPGRPRPAHRQGPGADRSGGRDPARPPDCGHGTRRARVRTQSCCSSARRAAGRPSPSSRPRG